MIAKLQEIVTNDPIKALALIAALVAFASTPIAFAVLGRIDWFAARRGRINLKPSFISIITGMLLVMGIPAIFAALVIKSGDFDANRYAFDPNHTFSVLEQGRGYPDIWAANKALLDQAKSLAEKEKNLVNGVKKLDEAMITLRNASAGSPTVAQALPGVLNSLAGVRQSIGLDGPQQLMDFTAPPAAIASGPRASVVPPGTAIASAAPVAPVPVPVAVAPTAPVPVPAAAVAPGALAPATVEAEIATVPAPQKKIAKMLPLVDLPKGWVVGKSGEKHLETFNAENLFEKIDGRAESFVQYSVVGMAYTYYHPAGDESNEVQIYIFEMADSLKALGKYGSEKPEVVKLIPVGTEGYSSAGSTLFHAGPYYTQIVSTRDDKEFADFALEIAKKVAAQQKPAQSVAGSKFSTSDSLFALLPDKSGKTAPKYVAEDVFAFSFLTDVFMADYKDGKDTWLGFIRPYQTADAAKEVLEKYTKTVKQDGAKTSEAKYEGADQVLISENIGLVDVVFRKGNSVGGINGATDKSKAEAFVKEMVKSVPATLPPLESDSKPKAKADGDGAEGEK